MRYQGVWGVAGVLALAVAPVLAAPANKPAAKPAKPAVVEAVPVYASRPGIHVPQATLLRPMTPAETEANAVWNLRAGLNVAALQCQYSPFLRTVKTYNDLLKDQSSELAAAQATMVGHFKRYDGARALNSFDQYTTKTYNSYSTLDAQYAFCLSASEIGRGALFLPKGSLGKYALTQVVALRLSLTPVAAFNSLQLVDAQPVPLPPVES